jgi:hypothetical protein
MALAFVLVGLAVVAAAVVIGSVTKRRQRLAMVDDEPADSVGSRRLPLAPAPVAAHVRTLLERLRPSLGTFELVVFVLAVADVARTVLSSPVKGLANQGDYQRLTIQLGVGPVASQPYSPYSLTAQYRLRETLAQLGLGPAISRHPSVYSYYFGYHSSELLLARVAIGLHGLILGGRSFDLRWLGAVNATLWCAALGALIVATRQLAVWPRRVAVVLLALAFTDFGYLEYSNSFFSEPAELGFVLLALGCAACVASSLRWWLPFAGYTVAAALAVSAKTEDAVLAIPFGVLGVVLAWRMLPTLRQRAAAAGASTAAIVGAGAWAWTAQVPYLRRYQLYDSVFDGILRTTDRPATALHQLGLAPSLARYAGFPTADARSTFARGGIQQSFFDHIGPGKIVGYYLGHPGPLITILNKAAARALDLRPPYANLPGASPSGLHQYETSSPWTLLHGSVLPHSLWFVVLVLLAGLALGIAGLVRPRAGTSPDVLIAAVAIAGLMFVQVPVGGGMDGVLKHMVTFNAVFDVILITVAVVAGEHLLGFAAGRRRAAVAAPGSVLRADRHGATEDGQRHDSRPAPDDVEDDPSPVRP